VALNNNSRVRFAKKISYFITLIALLSYQFLFRWLLVRKQDEEKNPKTRHRRLKLISLFFFVNSYMCLIWIDKKAA
jgi:hypothetical protein